LYTKNRVESGDVLYRLSYVGESLRQQIFPPFSTFYFRTLKKQKMEAIFLSQNR